ncbi:MAG: TonB-dependent receptor [Gemmatimonadota bacterium]|nr:MAG: TonB-dependent receptor [Gemmatimonadota bacterium]
MRRLPFAALAALTLVAAPLGAQQPQNPSQPSDTTTRNREQPIRLTPVAVTATRSEKDVFLTPTPVGVMDAQDLLELKPNTAADVFTRLPGLDVTGVGASQVRPSIRGQRGQRILLIQDGLRLNNARRQQDFGEIPALVDVGRIETIEVVRGPSSVLYGTDAIGGVVNMRTRKPRYEGIHGSLGFRYSEYDSQYKGVGTVNGRLGDFSFQVSGSARQASEYTAPSGTYGEITLDSATKVLNTGADDYNLEAYAAYEIAGRHEVWGKYERYKADTSGFGLIEPAEYTDETSRIEILYPFQTFDKVTAGYRGNQLNTPIADNVEFIGYYQDNSRQLNNNITGIVPFPGAEIQFFTENFTDIETLGGRLEAKKLAWGRVMWTYGVDYFRDNAQNADTSTNIMSGFGPPGSGPMVFVDSVANLQNASYSSVGLFAQADWQLTDRASVILGARWQNVAAKTKPTPGYADSLLTSETDRTIVAALNALYSVTDNVTLIGTVGRGFRSPNLVERFFAGPTPEGSGYQLRNQNLKPETSLNFDVGARFRNRTVYLEGFFFYNTIFDGIRIAATGDTISGMPAFMNVNVDELRFLGVELSGDVLLPAGFVVGANYTHFETKDVNDPQNPVGDSYSDKVVGRVRWTDPGRSVFAEYEFRWNGERKEVFAGSVPPVGPVLPAFMTHSVRAGWTFFRRGNLTQRIGVSLTNLTNELYAEFANASFFRPQPRRGLLVSWDMTF